ncbi:MAG: glutamate ligase domain-containing protein, partial [Candidatus Limnocylindrales bacterium]
PRVVRMAARSGARTLTYGFDDGADVTAADVASAGAAGMRFTLRTSAGRRAVATPALGRHGVHNALAGAATGLAAGLRLDEIVAGLEEGWQAPHRDTLIRAGEVTILDDSYNASPASVLAALDLLASLPARRRVAVLGEMLELGGGSEAGHREVGSAAASVAGLIVVVGAGADALAEAAAADAPATTRVLRATDASEALEVLRPRLRAGDVILVKGSRGVGLELVVDGLAAEATS